MQNKSQHIHIKSEKLVLGGHSLCTLNLMQYVPNVLYILKFFIIQINCYGSCPYLKKCLINVYNFA